MTREEIEKICTIEKRWYEIGYINGLRDAEPNLKSLWHNANDAPQGDKWKILCIDNFDLFWVMSKDSWLHSKWDEYVEIESVKMWAYIDDLLPKQFENSEQLKGEHNGNND